MSIGERIKARRLELNMTQEELALRMGYKSKTTINKIELGINDIPLSKVEEFAKALSTTKAYLMEWDDSDAQSYYLDPGAAQMAQELYDRPEMRVLFDASRKASKEDIEQVANLLEKLSKK